MTVTVRGTDPGGWSKIPHALARDPRLSHGARGLAVQMLSHADGFRSDEDFLTRFTADSRNAVRRQLAELRRLGYLMRERIRGDDGKLTTRSVLYDCPQSLEPSAGGNTAPPSRRTPARRSDQGRFKKTGQEPAATPWRDGSASANAEEPQVAPTRQGAASRSDQAQHDSTAGRTGSPAPGAHREEQREEQKKISRSARAREPDRPSAGPDGPARDSRFKLYGHGRLTEDIRGRRWLVKAFFLSEDQADKVIRTVRAEQPDIRNLVPYLEAMHREKDGEPKTDLLDIVEAVQTAGRRPTVGDEPEFMWPRGFVSPTGCSHGSPNADRTGCIVCELGHARAEKTREQPEQEPRDPLDLEALLARTRNSLSSTRDRKREEQPGGKPVAGGPAQEPAAPARVSR